MTDTYDVPIHRTYEPLKFLGRLFWVPLKVEPQTPLVSLTVTWEEDGKQWAPTIVARLPFSWAVGFGVWRDAPEEIVAVQEEDAEFAAYVAVNGDVPREEWSRVRKNVAAMDLDPDAEMEIMQHLGVFR